MYPVPEKETGDSLGATEYFKGSPDELQHMVEASGQTVSEADRYQLAKSSVIATAVSDFYVSTGTPNDYALAHSISFPPLPALLNGARFRFLAPFTNTGAATATVEGQSAKPIKKNNGANNLDAGDIKSGDYVELVYEESGVFFELVSTHFTSFSPLLQLVNDTFQVSQTLTTSPSSGTVGSYSYTPKGTHSLIFIGCAVQEARFVMVSPASISRFELNLFLKINTVTQKTIKFEREYTSAVLNTYSSSGAVSLISGGSSSATISLDYNIATTGPITNAPFGVLAQLSVIEYQFIK